MPAELKGRIQIDSSDLGRVDAAVRDFGDKVHHAFARTPDLRAHTAITGFVNYLQGGDVAGAIGSLASKITGLGLVGGVALGALGASIIAAHKELEAFDKSLGESEKLLSKMPEAGAGLETVKKHLAELIATTDKVKGPGIGGTILSLAGDVGGGFETEKRAERAAIDHKAAVDQIVRSLEQEAAGTRLVAASEVESLKLAEKIADIYQTQKERITEIIGKHMEQANTLRLIAKINETAHKEEVNARAVAEQERISGMSKQFKPLLEKSQFSFEELLNVPSTSQGGAGLLQMSAFKARQAQEEMNIGERFKREGSMQAAFEHFSRAEGIKAGIGNLKESEKIPEYAFKAAIDSASVFKEMVAALNELSDGIHGISFAGQ